MKRLFLLLTIVVFMFSCGIKTSDTKISEETERIITEVNQQIGLPNIINFQQKKTLKMIYELADKENLICYAYMYSDYQGKLVYIGRCVGYGIPFSAQYSNPEKIITFHDSFFYSGDSPQTIPQPEPNGLFMPTSSSATWLIMIDPETQEPRPVYFEPTIVVSPFKLLIE